MEMVHKEKKFEAELYDEVVSEAKLILKKREHYALYNIICLSHQNQGKYKDAIEIMQKGLNHNSKNVYFLNNLGVSYYKLFDYNKANYYFIRGLSIEPNYISILNNLGNLNKDLNKTEEAIKYYKKCISLDYTLDQPFFNIALCYESLGNFKEAKKYLETIIKRNSNFTEADRILANITKNEKGNIHFLNIKEKLLNKNLNDNQKKHLYFALGKYFEDLNSYKEAFENYKKGNDLSKKISKYNIKSEYEHFKTIKNFPIEKFKSNQFSNQKKIIFIVGMPRSGTSLVEQIITSHKDVYGGGELNFIEKIVNEKFLKISSIENFDDYECLDILLDSKKDYDEKIKLLFEKENFFTDKAPLNFKYIGFIKKIFPNSKIINCIRDPIDVSWSNYKNFFSSGLGFSNDLSDIGKFYNLYLDYIKLWKKNYSKSIFDVNYSELINNPTDTIRNLILFCEIEWNDCFLNHHQNLRSIKTASSSQARKPIYKTALKASNKFDEYLNDLKEIINP